MKKIIRKNLIEDKIKDVIDSINIVAENIHPNFTDFASSGLIKDGIYKKLEFAIESIIDICAIINSDLNLGSPETEESIFDNLEKNKIFDKKIVELIREMRGFRNILVHKYGKINDKQAFETVKDGLKDFEVIIKEFENFLLKNYTGKKLGKAML